MAIVSKCKSIELKSYHKISVCDEDNHTEPCSFSELAAKDDEEGEEELSPTSHAKTSVPKPDSATHTRHQTATPKNLTESFNQVMVDLREHLERIGKASRYTSRHIKAWA